jgi:large subunit ribosomal protein L34
VDNWLPAASPSHDGLPPGPRCYDVAGLASGDPAHLASAGSPVDLMWISAPSVRPPRGEPAHFRTLSTRGSETATKGHNIVVGSLLQWVWRKSRLDCWSRPPGLAFPRRDSIRGGGPQQDKLTGPADRVIAVRAAPRGLRVYSPAEERGPIKRTYQPKKKYRRRVHGFLRRMNTAAGVRLIRNRRRKGRHRLTPG